MVERREIERGFCVKCSVWRGSLGLEPTPELYVQHLVAIFREVRRVLRKDGMCFVNMGDCYAADTKWGGSSGNKNYTSAAGGFSRERKQTGLKPKDLCMMPARIAIALQQPYYTGRITQQLDREWLAAAIDAEGCIYIQRRPGGTMSGRVKEDGSRSAYTEDNYQPGLRITNGNEAFVHRAAAIARVGSVRKIAAKQRRRDFWEWSCYSQETRALLRELYPHLIAKQDQARIAIAAPTQGDGAEASWRSLKALHVGKGPTIDFPPPTTLYEPGWYLRSDIVWSKPNPMPESVTDRPTKSHEFIFLLTKSATYFYDAEAVKEPSGPFHPCGPGSRADNDRDPAHGTNKQDALGKGTYTGFNARWRENPVNGRNLRSVWTIATEPFPDAHFATFPSKLVETCVKAGTSERGACATCGAPWERETQPTGDVNQREAAHQPGNSPTKVDSTGWAPTSRASGDWKSNCDCGTTEIKPCLVFDPFCGSGTVPMVAQELGRVGIGVDLKASYLDMAKKRTAQSVLL